MSTSAILAQVDANSSTPDSSLPTLLIVEDERSNLVSLERIFQREGFRTLLADDARIGLDVCRKQRVHVVLTDLMLPGMSGIDLIKALHTVAPDAEVVVMTAYGTVESAVEAMREGGFNLGGEQSGHLVFLDHATTGDGIVAALQVLALALRSGIIH